MYSLPQLRASVWSERVTAVEKNEVTFVPNTCGKQLAIVNGYTFYLHMKHKSTVSWLCTSWGKCKARFTMKSDGVIKKVIPMHSHERPMFKIINGVFFKC
ncbi:Modifier of mdg4 [Operophtera brumata]|uniref:Modifier of mdg4 n=1 Tax=Operophtera brumata TaxID=104452 RepID=A0A0L7LEZ4_OPEBR|nr:Modifier of mdg4 [Operophtera brumata]